MELNTPQTRPELETLADVSRRTGLGYSALRHAALKAAVAPVARAADRRLFDGAGVAVILKTVASGRPRCHSMEAHS